MPSTKSDWLIQSARLAEQSIDSGMAQNKLERLIQLTKKK